MTNWAWKGIAWEISNRLYEKGLIENPRNKDKSLILTRSGHEACIKAFKKLFWEPVNAQDAMFPLPIDMERLRWLYQYLDDGSITQFYIDSVTGEIVSQEIDEEKQTSPTMTDPSIDPRYLRIPVQSHDEYMSDLRDYCSLLQSGDLNSAIISIAESSVSLAEATHQSRTLLINHEKWEKWREKRIYRRLLAWLAEHGIEPR